MRRLTTLMAGLVATGTVLSGCGFLGIGGEADLQIYSARHYDLEKAFEAFTEETGVSVEFLDGDDAELLERLKAEGEDSPADLFITVDAGMLWNAGEEGVLDEVDSAVLDEAVPADLRDSGGRWFGLAMRARTVVYDPDAVDPTEFDDSDTYAGLTDEKWQGRLCLRTAQSSYTQSLVASLIDLHGEERTREIVEGWLANDAEIKSNDVELLDAINDGECEVGITNHYYLARQIEEYGEDYDVALHWASQDGDGTHANISGAGIVASSDNKTDARALLEWLADDGQSAFVDANHELPVNPEVEPEPIAASFGPFERMPVDAEAYGALNADAVDLLAEAGYE
ncbi:extracellular solute-binding protein [Nocardioides panacisoli]|uniref:extracellular solute-binding protein n=1 Tax=Nocardioides panacisoli TaxID=627624 RepID=UPI001C635A71|nr:extracellular solute-binding protein [Nocardioides panacisoli]QYJ04935.1 extracellular solute-binding protein [Nocardioides panacisoli]